jgi:hypothetical protein
MLQSCHASLFLLLYAAASQPESMGFLFKTERFFGSAHQPLTEPSCRRPRLFANSVSDHQARVNISHPPRLIDVY